MQGENENGLQKNFDHPGHFLRGTVFSDGSTSDSLGLRHGNLHPSFRVRLHPPLWFCLWPLEEEPG